MKWKQCQTHRPFALVFDVAGVFYVLSCRLLRLTTQTHTLDDQTLNTYLFSLLLLLSIYSIWEYAAHKHSETRARYVCCVIYAHLQCVHSVFFLFHFVSTINIIVTLPIDAWSPSNRTERISQGKCKNYGKKYAGCLCVLVHSASVHWSLLSSWPLVTRHSHSTADEDRNWKKKNRNDTNKWMIETAPIGRIIGCLFRVTNA